MKKRIKIEDRLIGENEPVFIIAEAGVNHNGSAALAKKLVDAAKKAGADAVKFQTFDPEELTTKSARMTPYQKRNTGKNHSQLELVRGLALSAEEFAELSRYCKKRNIVFLSTPHSGFGSVDVLKRLNIPAYKIGSGDLTNLPILDYVARIGKPILIATGMASEAEVAEAVRCIRKAGNPSIVVLQCTTDYPAKPEETNLRAMVAMGRIFRVLVGFSDHTVGPQASMTAVALGASVIEKHLTLDNSMHGPDHKASANPADFARFVKDIRRVETILGSQKKAVTSSAQRYRALVLKSVVAKRAIRKGERFTRDNLSIKRPGTGLAPKLFWRVVGKRARRNVKSDTLIRRGDY